MISLLFLVLVHTATGSDDGFEPIFDGTTLTGWRAGDPAYWSVEDGAITGRITQEHPCTINQYLIWEGGELADFELKLESRLNGDGAINNGFQFRSRELPDHDVCGYQMDNNLQTPWLVRLYDEYGRHDLALRGERAVFDANGVRTPTPLPDAAGEPWFKLEDWHEYHLVCIGGKITLRVNGRIAAEIEDNDPRRAEPQGILALQLHSGPPTEVQFRNVRIKVLTPAAIEKKKPSDTETRRAALLETATSWWEMDTAGRGAKLSLLGVPQFYQLQLNVAATGPGANRGERCVTLEGAYFDAGKTVHATGEAITAYMRARDPSGDWNSALFAKRGGHDRVHFNLFSADLDGDGSGEIGFELRTKDGFKSVSFSSKSIDATAWHDLVGRYDGDQIEIYCNGKKMAGAPLSGDLITNDEPLLIGAETNEDAVVRHFHGEIQDVALWPRALSEEEIALLSRR